MPDNTALRLNPDGSLSGYGTDRVPPTIPGIPAGVASETVSFGPARTVWTQGTRISFPTVGAGYHTFENEIIQAASTDRAAIVTKYVNVYRGQHDNLSANDIALHRARLRAFVTTYEANWP